MEINEKDITIDFRVVGLVDLAESIIEKSKDEITKFRNLYEAERLKNEKLVAALQFYARGEHWTLRPMTGETICDKGAVAKKALADIDTKETKCK